MLPLQKATYTARACGAASLAPSSKGNMQIAIPFEVSAGEFAGETITWIGVMHETADRNGVTGIERVIASVQYAGWQGDDISELVGIDDTKARELMPEEVSLACDVEEYDGKTRLKVQWVNKAGAGRFAFKEQIEGNSLKSFAAQLKSTVRSVRASNGGGSSKPAGNGATKPAPGGYGGAGGNKDDLPF